MKYLLWLLFLFTACVSSELIYVRDPIANQIEFVDYIKPSLRNELEELDQVKCSLGRNGHTFESNKESCYNLMANLAAKMGGHIVFLDPIRQKVGASFAEGPTYCTYYRHGMTTCTDMNSQERGRDSVDFVGIVYKKKTSVVPNDKR
jgi:hypothetical protein